MDKAKNLQHLLLEPVSLYPEEIKENNLKEHRVITKLMGCAFELIIGHPDIAEGTKLLENGIGEIKRIEGLLSEFKPGTFTTMVNEQAGIDSVACDGEIFSLMERCLKISSLTRGAFDITVGPLKKIYQFKNKQFEFPGIELINEALGKVGFKKIRLNAEEKKVFLLEKNMHISFAAIGKGFAADCVKQMWLKQGVRSAIISASGDLTTIGKRMNGKSWKIGIADPDNKEKMICYIPVENASVATSGDYEQYFMHNGKRYSHNINPVTGMPVKGIKSVSIISPMAELSDALATAVYIMGTDTGLHFINQLPATHCIIIDDRNKCHYSDKINLSHEI